VAIGAHIVDLHVVEKKGFFDDLHLPKGLFSQATLNDFLRLGRPVWRAVRQRISELLRHDNSQAQALAAQLLVLQTDAQMCMPVAVGDYTDFYSSIEHATNVGKMFRDPANALLPNWKHIPVGYHGRASSIVISGTDVRRPLGQTLPNGEESPIFGPSRLLDFELEVAFITGQGKPLGERISIEEAPEYIFGFVLFNDWSARDIQKWEYVPLGPFLAKNFASSISPWIVTLDALEPFRVQGAKQDPPVLPYLRCEQPYNFDVNLEVLIAPEGADEPTTVCQSNFKYMYWNVCQQLAHHTVNGCNINAGDMLASGTISGSDPSAYGSMLELAWRGEKPLTLRDGSQRKFINDHDTVIMRGFASNANVRIGFGQVSGKVLPATEF